MNPAAVSWIAGGVMMLPGVVWLVALAAGWLPDEEPMLSRARNATPAVNTTGTEGA